jgi:acetolactate synthase-1/2/3 large subunit
MPTCAEVIAGFLAERGVQRVFGMPGDGASLAIMEAARKRELPFVLAGRPAAAAMMAAAEAEITGRPGVCLLGQGPAVAAAVDGVAHALLDRAPLLVLADRPSRTSLRLATRQGLDQLRLLDGVAKERATLTAARSERLLRWAWDKACRLPRGPVHVDVPADQADKPARRRGLRPQAEEPSGPSPHAVRSAARLLARRGRAVTIAGLGCRSTGAAPALRELIEHLGTPLFTTQKAKGIVPEDHPLAAGVFWGGRLEQDLLGRADAVLAVGLDSVELLPRAWRSGAPVVVLSDTPGGPRPYQPAAEVVGDIGQALTALREASPPWGEWSLAGWAGLGERFKARARARLAEAGTGRGGEGLGPHRVVAIAREVFPRDTIATVDAGAQGLVTSVFWDTYEPIGYLCSSGLGPMGYAVPAASAARLAAPDRPIVAFLGDGALLTSLPDLAAAARLGLALVLIVFLDGSLSGIRVAQEQRSYDPVGLSLGSLDVPKLAEGLGVLATEVGDEESLRAALQEAATTAQPAVVGVRVRGQNYRRLLDVLRGREA